MSHPTDEEHPDVVADPEGVRRAAEAPVDRQQPGLDEHPDEVAGEPVMEPFQRGTAEEAELERLGEGDTTDGPV